MPKSLMKQKEEDSTCSTSPDPASAAVPEPQIEVKPAVAAVPEPQAEPKPAVPGSVDVSLIFMLYKKCLESGYQNCDVLKQMAIDSIKDRLKLAIEAELAKLVKPEFRTQIGQICIEI